VFVSLLAITPDFARAGQQARLDSQEKLRRAEALADRFVTRFVTTLDFKHVYEEMYVDDKRLRRRDLDYILSGIVSKELIAQLDDGSVGRLYTSFMNTTYLSWLYALNKPRGLSDDDFPRDVNAEIKRTAFNRCRFLDRHEDCRKVDEEVFKTKRDLEWFISTSDRLSSLFRKHIPRRPLRSLAYNRNVRDLVWNGRPSRIDNGDSYFDISQTTPVYEVSRGMFLFQIIEEQGAMRVFNLHLFQ